MVRPDFVELRDGDALSLPVDDAVADVAAQNCLFNIFDARDLDRALAEMWRALGRAESSCSPTRSRGPDPQHLVADNRLRAMCLSGAIPPAVRQRLVEIGFGTIEVRARRPYRVLAGRFGMERDIVLESLEMAAIKDPDPRGRACVFTGRTAIYHGAAHSSTTARAT